MNFLIRVWLFVAILVVNVLVSSAFSLPPAHQCRRAQVVSSLEFRGVTMHSSESPLSHSQPRFSSHAIFSSTPNQESSSEASAISSEASPSPEEESSENNNKSIMQRIRSYFVPKKDNLTFRQRLAKMGLAAVLSYGWVSNMSYSVTVSLAWYIFSKQTGNSPLAPGQWKGFLAVYAGFYIFNNIVRPIRLAAAVAISPQFDKIVLGIQNRFRVSKAAAVTITVILANLIGTTVCMSAGIILAAALAGVPIFAPPV